MHDEIDGRLWAAHHRDFAEALRRIGAAIMVTFCKIIRSSSTRRGRGKARPVASR